VSQQGASPAPASEPASAPSSGQLVSQLSEEMSRLVRDEFRLAQLEMSGKAKQAGIGAGMVGTAGLLALYGAGVLIAAAVLGLALVLDAWLAAVIVGAVLLGLGGIVAILGKKRISDAAPPLPNEAIGRAKEDVDAVRHPGAHH
jgi:hypothetical protein